MVWAGWAVPQLDFPLPRTWLCPSSSWATAHWRRFSLKTCSLKKVHLQGAAVGDAWSWGLVVGWFLLPLESGLGRAEQKSKSCSRSLFLNLAIVVCPIKSRGGGRRIQGFLQQHSKLSELEASLGYRKPVSRKKKKKSLFCLSVCHLSQVGILRELFLSSLICN